MICGSSSKVMTRLRLCCGEDSEEKIDGGVLLELDAVADAVGSVQQDADAEGEIGLFAEITDFLGSLSSKIFEVGFFQRRDELVAAVQHGEENVDEVDGDDDGLSTCCGAPGAVQRVAPEKRFRLGADGDCWARP